MRQCVLEGRYCWHFFECVKSNVPLTHSLAHSASLWHTAGTFTLASFPLHHIFCKLSTKSCSSRKRSIFSSSSLSLIFGLMLAFSPVLQMSVGVFVALLTGWWILALGIIRIVHAFHLLKIKRESDGFGFGEMLGSNWWIALILGALLTIFGVIVILNPMLGLGVIGVLIGCGVITAGINLIYLGCSPWIL